MKVNVEKTFHFHGTVLGVLLLPSKYNILPWKPNGSTTGRKIYFHGKQVYFMEANKLPLEVKNLNMLPLEVKLKVCCFHESKVTQLPWK